MSCTSTGQAQRVRAFLPEMREWHFRVAILLGLFAAQGLWLTFCFDAASISNSADGWNRFFQFTPLLLRIGISLLVSTVLLGRDRIRQHAQVFAAKVQEHRTWLIWSLGQWSAFGILTAASIVIFADSPGAMPLNSLMATLWILSALATTISFLFSLAPPSFWVQFVRREWCVLLIGLATSTCAATAGRLFQQLWGPLGDSTFLMVEFWLSLVYSSSIVSDASNRVLGTESFLVEIAPQCSGYEGIGLVSAFVLAFLVVFRQTLRFPRAWLLLPLGCCAIWICNSLRIAALIVIGTEYSASVALGGFHSQAGWILFNLVSLGLMSSTLRSRFFLKSESESLASSPATAYLAPFLVLTALSMLTAAIADDPAMLYPVGVIASLLLLWRYRSVLPRWTISRFAIVQGVAVFGIWVSLACLSHSSSDAEQHLPDCTTAYGLGWVLFRCIGAVVTVPIIEELAFRGFLLRRLTRSDFESVDYTKVPTWAIAISSLVFGMLHAHWLGGIIAGISYAITARRGRNLGEAVVAHAITNSLLTITVLATGAYWLW